MTMTMKKPHAPKGAKGKKSTKDRAPEPAVTMLLPRQLTPLIAVVPEPPSVESFYPKELKAASKAETSEDEDDGESEA